MIALLFPLFTTTAILLTVKAETHTYPFDTNTYKVEQLSEIFRNGARAPSHIFTGEKMKDFFDGFGSMELFPNGLKQHYNLGTFLRAQYPDIFANGEIQDAEFRMISSDDTRCLYSA